MSNEQTEIQRLRGAIMEMKVLVEQHDELLKLDSAQRLLDVAFQALSEPTPPIAGAFEPSSLTQDLTPEQWHTLTNSLMHSLMSSEVWQAESRRRMFNAENRVGTEIQETRAALRRTLRLADVLDQNGDAAMAIRIRRALNGTS